MSINRTWSIADAATGFFTGAQLCCPDHALSHNTPPGCVAVPGAHDHLCRRLHASGVVVPWQPPAPAADALRTWAWDATQERWLPVATEAAVAADVRAERDRRLAACDWTQAADVIDDMAPQQRTAWRQYRRALRDITQQPTFPAAVMWPVEPI